VVGGTVASGATGDLVQGPPGGELDPLVSNGLSSPLCDGGLGAGELSSAARRNCETSGFVAAAAPTGNYGLDVHIETGFLGLSGGTFLIAVQDFAIAPIWTALVWCVHALLAMLEWAFTIDLLDSPSAGGLGRALQAAQAGLTVPWLALALAVAAVLAVYNGLFRRRVAQTVGQTLVMGAMMAGGLWLIADPTASLGAAGGWASQAGLGTLAVVADGHASQPGRTLADSMNGVFAASIEGPWCYLEFGDVEWCRDPARLEASLHSAARAIAARELQRIGCSGGAGSLGPCVESSGPQARSVRATAQLLREADTNGAIFLALPPNGPARNAISEQGSLLSAICRSSEATSCEGPAAAQAEFRTDSGTWPRAAGLLMIIAGVLGMLLLLGFIGVRILGASLLSLLYLLLAPGIVLAPAFGEAGRALFRRWAVRLLAAVVSKLVFSFLLGVVLATGTILLDLGALGWWTQWLLLSAFWWTAYLNRHQALGAAHGAIGVERRAGLGPVQRVHSALGGPKQLLRSGRTAKATIAAKRQKLAKHKLPKQRDEGGDTQQDPAPPQPPAPAAPAAPAREPGQTRAPGRASGPRPHAAAPEQAQTRPSFQQELERAVREPPPAPPRRDGGEARHNVPGEEGPGGNTPPGPPPEVSGAPDDWSQRVMQDAREVAAGRKRRLGFDQE